MVQFSTSEGIGRVPGEDVAAAALVSELDWAEDNGDPTYVLLSAARALAFAIDGLLLSKPEGWLWARQRGVHPRLLDTAMVSFLTGTDPALSPEAARDLLDLVSTVRGTLVTASASSFR